MRGGSYAIDAEARGKLRRLRARLIEQVAVLDAARNDPRTADLVAGFTGKGSPTGRQRALARLARALGPAVRLEGARLKGPWPLAVWVHLRAQGSVIVEADDPGLLQDSVTTNYVLAGRLPTGPGMTGGVWTIEVANHALGRLLQRSPAADPERVLLEAHRAVLRARLADIAPLIPGRGSFLLPSGPGVFICQPIVAEDIVTQKTEVFVRAATWLDFDMLHDDQSPVAIDAGEGDSLGDSFLLPLPLREIVEEGNIARVLAWVPGMPRVPGKKV